jgi:O-antigen/teichoic acid export membrane protein
MEYARIMKDGVHLLAGKVGTIILTMLDLMILARVLSTEEMGRYSLFFMVVNLAITLGLSWSDSSIVRHGREEYVQTKKINQSFWARMYLFGPILLFCAMLFLIFMNPITTYIGVGRWMIAFIVALFIIQGLVNFNIRVFQSIDLMRKSAYVLLYQKLAYFVGLGLIFLGLFPGNLTTVLLFVNLSFLATLILNFFQVDLNVLKPYTFSKKHFKEIWSYSWPQLFGFSGLYIVNYVDLFVIRRYMELSDVGVYNVAYNGFTNILGIIMLIYTLYMPVIVEYRAKKKHEDIENYMKRLPVFLTGWTVLAMIGIALSGIVIPLLFSDKYVLAIPSFQVLLVATVFYFVSIYLLPLVNAFDLIIYSQIFNVIKSLANVIADFMLVPQIGIIGAAYGTLIGYAMSAVLSSILVYWFRSKIFRGK